jgi:hypothetical protein
MIVIGLPAHTAGVHCSACQAIVSTRNFQRRTVGEVLCRACRPGQAPRSRWGSAARVSPPG